jgi:GGDEF domain-containing protein
MSSLTLWIVVVAAAGAAVVFGLLALVLGRPRNKSEASEQESREASTVVAPTDAPEIDRLRNVAGFAADIDLGELCAHVLRVAVDAASADAGAIAVDCSEPASSILDSSGLTTTEVEWLTTSLTAYNDSSMITRYIYEHPTGPEERFVTAMLVPIRDSESEPIGNLAALWRSDLGDKAEVHLRALEAVAADATGAMTNAMRFHEVSALSIRDTETGLFNRRYFAGQLDAEVERAHQSGASLTLLLVGLDESQSATPNVDSQLMEVAELVRFELSGRGEICRVGLTEIAVLLPRSVAELRASLERIHRRLTEGGDGTVVSALELDDHEDSASLFERAKSSATQDGRLPIGTVRF